MKLSALRITLALCATGASLIAAPLTAPTAVHALAETASPVIATLKPGTEPVVAVGVTAPAGWTAVTLAGPHEVYAANKDVTKSLDVRPGSPYLLEPKTDAQVFAIADKDDQTEIIDYRGKWTKFRLSKSVTGYIQSPITPPAPAKVTSTANIPTPAPLNDAPAAPAQAIVPVGKPAPTGDGGSTALPRLFQGKFASTYNPLRPRRPYEYQLNDNAGARYAYVDVSKLLATEQISKFVDRMVVVYGTARPVAGTQDMVIVAESLQLR